MDLPELTSMVLAARTHGGAERHHLALDLLLVLLSAALHGDRWNVAISIVRRCSCGNDMRCALYHHSLCSSKQQMSANDHFSIIRPAANLTCEAGANAPRILIVRSSARNSSSPNRRLLGLLTLNEPSQLI